MGKGFLVSDSSESEAAQSSDDEDEEFNDKEDDEMADEVAWLSKDMFNDEKRVFEKKSKKELREERAKKQKKKSKIVTKPSSGSSCEGEKMESESKREYGDTGPFS